MPKSDTARVPWIIRTYAGFGDAEQSNRRYRENLAHGQRGLSVAFDLPTQNGYDADDAMAAGEIGGTGVSVSHLGDMDTLFREIDQGAINTSMTITRRRRGSTRCTSRSPISAVCRAPISAAPRRTIC